MAKSANPSAVPVSPRWLLALESSTAHGGAALVRDGEIWRTILLPEGLRHGRELMAATAGLLAEAKLAAADLHGVAVSVGPGSYTGTRVGVMSAKALAFGAGIRLTAVSSLAAMAESMRLAGAAGADAMVLVLQDARRDEVYAGLYAFSAGEMRPIIREAAIAPEEAAALLGSLHEKGDKPVLAGSGFVTHAPLFAGFSGFDPIPRPISPGAVGILGWRQILQGDLADPMTLQPLYLRRDRDADWKKDALIG